MPALFEDVIPTPSTRTVTRDGYLVVPATLARSGIQQYRFGELGIKDGKHKPDDMVNVYRSPESLRAAAETFEAQTVTLNHAWTDAKNWRRHAVGDVHDIRMDGGNMTGTLVLRDADAIAKINAGRSQLSNGYKAEIVPRAGVYEGQSYEFEQLDLVGNHVAIVDQGRCGAACRIADSAGCHCGGTCEKCKDPRREYMKRMEHSWERALPPNDEDEPEGDDDDSMAAYKRRLERAWQRTR